MTEQSDTVRALKRRGILAAAGAVVAGMVAKQASEPVAALTYVELGSRNNFTTTTTGVANSSLTLGVGPALYGARLGSNYLVSLGADAGVLGITEVSNADGVIGQANSGGFAKGVHGVAAGGYGVYGEATGSLGYGVTGVSTDAYGVLGRSDTGQGVRGQITAVGAAAGTIAVYGENRSTNTGGSPGNGGFGCYGFSEKGHGLVGATNTAGGGALVGSTNGVVGAYAGIFYGPVAVVGGGKSAAVKNADGSHSLLYCVESPESWFEDFGTGQLVSGKAEVKIDPGYAAVADMSDYHVFLTEHGTHHHLSVGERTASGFIVAADIDGARLKGKQAADLVGTFSYRVVARRKDIKTERLARVHLPPEPKRPDPSADLRPKSPGAAPVSASPTAPLPAPRP